jgi:hypothetical protein
VAATSSNDVTVQVYCRGQGLRNLLPMGGRRVAGRYERPPDSRVELVVPVKIRFLAAIPCNEGPERGFARFLLDEGYETGCDGGAEATLRDASKCGQRLIWRVG